MTRWQNKLDTSQQLRASDSQDEDEDEDDGVEPVIVPAHPDTGALISLPLQGCFSLCCTPLSFSLTLSTSYDPFRLLSLSIIIFITSLFFVSVFPSRFSTGLRKLKRWSPHHWTCRLVAHSLPWMLGPWWPYFTLKLSRSCGWNPNKTLVFRSWICLVPWNLAVILPIFFVVLWICLGCFCHVTIMWCAQVIPMWESPPFSMVCWEKR